LSKFKELMTQERLTEQEVLKKKQYVKVCSLKMENSSLKYSELATLLNVSHPFLNRKLAAC